MSYSTKTIRLLAQRDLNLVRNLIAKYSTYNFYIMKEENNWKTPFSVFVVF